MRRLPLAGLAIAAAAALLVIPYVAGPDRASDRSPHAKDAAPISPNARDERTYKQWTVRQDMEMTEQLCRRQCARDVRRMMLTGAARALGDGSPSRLEALRKAHPKMRTLAIVSPRGTVVHGLAPEQLPADAAAYWRQAVRAVRGGENYESPAFELQGRRHFVIGLADSGRGGGMAALVSSDVVQDVAKQQRRNLRIDPYPAEGRYRIESVRPNTGEEMTVRSGEDNGNASHYTVDEVVVKFASKPDAADLLRLRRELDLTVVRHTGPTYLLRSRTRRTEELIAYFRDRWRPKPVYVEPHYLYLTNEEPDAGAFAPNDTFYSQYQWNLPVIRTEKGWRTTRGSQDVVVAVVDTGVQLDHPDLAGRLVEGYNVVDPSLPPEDDLGHGTHVAGIIAARVNNQEGVAGMTWYTKIMPIKALDSTGAGTTYSVAEGILWAVDHGADIINMSLGNYAETEFLHDAIRYAHERGVVLIAASGNDNTDRPGFPAAYPEVFAVAATDPDAARAAYSNYGDYIDVAAPGTSIPSTYPGNQYASLSGTSMACPHVSALASLVRAVNPGLSNDDVLDLIRQTAVDLGQPGKDAEFGYGQIDVARAVEAAGGGSPASLQLLPDRVRRQLDAVPEGK